MNSISRRGIILCLSRRIWKGKTFTKEEQTCGGGKFLKAACAKRALPKRYTPERLAKVQEKYPGKDPLEVVSERLDYELDVIVPKGMGDYLLDRLGLHRLGQEQVDSHGAGTRFGSGLDCLYLIGITDIEPLRFNLFFERFINPERISYPDIDVDICMDRRGRGDRLYGAQIWQGQSRADHHLWHDESQDGDQRCRPGFERSACESQ